MEPSGGLAYGDILATAKALGQLGFCVCVYSRSLAAGTVLGYLKLTRIDAVAHIRSLATYSTAGFMGLDATARRNLEILDRIGGGDSFASGLIYGFLAGKGPQWAVECGSAHGALAMTTPGDTTMVTLPEVGAVQVYQMDFPPTFPA